MLTDELYAALATVLDESRVYDTKLPDGYVVSDPVAVFQCISDTAESEISGAIVHQVARWQVTIRALDIATARTTADAVIAALHGLTGTSIAYCEFESRPGEFFEADVIPFVYHIPLDFMIQH